jgi:hypothetical protein
MYDTNKIVHDGYGVIQHIRTILQPSWFNIYS